MGPILVYDDTCDFCTKAAKDANRQEDYELVGFSELSDGQIEKLPEDYDTCSHIIHGDTVYSCGDVVQDVIYRAGPSHAYKLSTLPGVKEAIDCGYKVVAQNRRQFGKLYKLLK